MLSTPRARRGMITSPHHLASEAGLAVLRDGGNAIEAMVAAASTIAVVYPHMNSIGGDGFWLISQADGLVTAIESCGGAGQRATIDYFLERGCEAMPARGPLAANTVAGAVGGWATALKLSQDLGGRLPLGRLLEEAVHHARHGFAVSHSQKITTDDKSDELEAVAGFAETFLQDGSSPAEGTALRQDRLALSLARLAEAGLDDFYRGDLARSIAADLERVGSPVTLSDLEAFKTRQVTPLTTWLTCAQLYGMPPPTQGVAGLAILGMFDQLTVPEAEGFDFVHGLVEATKLAYRDRNDHVTDPDFMQWDPQDALSQERLAAAARKIDPSRAQPWSDPAVAGDTVWLGAIDGDGLAVSYIQSIYWEYGSGLVLPESGILWQNRGSSFQLGEDDLHRIQPGRRPFHTLIPGLAHFKDGRRLVFGCMGGEGQPQIKSAVFARYGLFGQAPQQAVTAPRWLLGKAWGEDTTTLKMEDRFDPAVIEQLRRAGHVVELVAPFDELVAGHAGAVARHADGLLEGAADPRSDGSVGCF
ncbi:MAG: gamma-glutamyltransferase family protein [Pseudomonadota bacterium]